MLKLLAKRDDGSTTKIELIRSLDWIRETLGAEAAELATLDRGSQLRLEIPELRLNDYADVLAIEACPELFDGPGEVVTGTYHTDRAAVVDLRFAGSSRPIGTTAEHLFWSVSRQDFFPAGKLEIGEQVVALDGQHFRLTSITPRAGPEPVFNLEVANQHVYYVGGDGLLVHNAGKNCKVVTNLISGKGAKGAKKGTGVKKANIKKTTKKFQPNPNGKRGSKAHRSVVGREEKAMGKKYTQVAGGKMPEKKYGNRFPDLVFKTKTGKLIAVQVGKETKGGVPIARERRAIADLRSIA